MKIILMRHGEAERFASSDSQRCLTDRGRAETRQVCLQQKADLEDVTHVVVSPYVRAQQTAEIVLELLGLQAVTTTESIIPGASPEKAVKFLEDHCQEYGVDNLLVICHMPIVGLMTSYLVDGQIQHYGFATSSFLGIELPMIGPGCGTKLWHRYPE